MNIYNITFNALLCYRQQNVANASYVFNISGYLSIEEASEACAKYSNAYHMKISEGRLQTAINKTHSIDPTPGFVNIGLFCRFLDNVLLNEEPTWNMIK